MNIKHLEVLIMKTLLKVIACAVDVSFLPIRFIIGLEIVLTYAIMSDSDIKETLSGYWHGCRQIPSVLKESIRSMFNME